MSVHVLPAPWNDRAEELRALRREVFVVEQQVPEALEWDGTDHECAHFMALDSTGQMLGCARLTPAGQIGRMAVLRAHRGRGIGAQLLEEAVSAAAERGHDQVFLHAQQHAEAFYRRAGFLPQGEPYEEAGIPHITMTRQLPVSFEAPALPAAPKAPPHPTDSRIEATAEARKKTLPAAPFANEGEARAALLSATKEPRRHLALLSPELDPALFDSEALCEALSAFVRSSPGTQLRILIYSSKRAIESSHRLLALARRLDDRILLAKVPEEHARDERSFLVWDNEGYWLQPGRDTYDGLSNGHDPVMAARLRERFDYLWERSAPDPELRQLKL